MNYYKITLQKIPTIIFAHRYETERYGLRFKKTPSDTFELPYIEKGTICFSNQRMMPEGTLNFAVYDCDVSGTSHGMPHKHVTVGVRGGIWETVSPETLLRDIRTEYQSDKLFFAARDTAFLQKTSEQAKAIIEEIIAMQLAERSKTAVQARLFSLFSLITQDTLSSLLHETDHPTYSDHLYCDKAREYISEHIYERIHVEDIAENLSLSRGHLSRIFKSVTESTLIEYINKTKIDAICEILDTVGGTAEELAELFSLNDEKYLCRLFKRYRGVSISEYKKRRR